MKKQQLLTLIVAVFCVPVLFGQSTETFESETPTGTSFTDNGQVFDITSQLQGPFDIRTFAGTGWNGSTADNSYIANHYGATENMPVAFTISSAGNVPFLLNSMYLKLGDHNKQINVTGSLTIVGKLAGTVVFTATGSTGFNQNPVIQNGFSSINLATFGGSNNSLTDIDQILISTGNAFNYVAVDAFSWTKVPFSASQTQVNVSCNGGSNGSATVSTIGGTAPFTYSWAPSGGTGSTASGLAPGTYTVTITDATTTQITKTFTITQPAAPLSATTSKANVSCNGGSNASATIAASGGTSPYTYSWAPSGGTAATASGLAAGTYTCTITDANTCTITKTVTITQPLSPLAAITGQTNLSCNMGSNGSAVVTASGGTSPYTYSWTPSGGTAATASGLAAGTYTCTITDANACTIAKAVTITEPAAITATITQLNVSCKGGNNASATVAASGGTGAYTYSWAPSGGTAATASGLAAGTYTCTITDVNTCTGTKIVTITEPAAIAAFATQANVSCNGGSNASATVTASGGTGSYTYSWTPSGGTAATASGLSAGTYTCTITDANTCTATATVTITEPAAITATTTQADVSCNGGSNASATVTAGGGAGAFTYSWAPSGGTAATATGLTAGTYTCTITDANSCSTTKTVAITEPAAITHTQTLTICAGDSIIVGTHIYNFSGIFTDVLPAANSCDSTVTTNLTVLPANTATQSFIICNGDSITVGTHVYHASGMYKDIFTAKNNCDSIVTTSLTVLPANATTQAYTICHGDSIAVGIHVYHVSGVYTDIFTAKNNCDSTVTTSLTVLPANTTAQAYTICHGDSIAVGTHVYHVSGVYTDIFTAKNNCDSIVTTSLKVLPLNTVSQTLKICAGAHVTIGTHVYTVSGTYKDTLVDANGCDSLLTTVLTVNNALNTAIFVNGNTLTANATGVNYQWIDCKTLAIIPGATNQSFTPAAGGVYAVIISSNGCSDTSICKDVIVTGINDHSNNNINIYPNPNSGVFTIKYAKAGNYAIVNSLGQVVREFKIDRNEYPVDMEGFTNGVYYITGTNNNQLFKQKMIISK